MAKADSENIRDALVSRAAVDSAAFALLYDIYYERIFNYCVSRIRARQIAEDITSAVFITAAEKASKFRGRTRIEFANRLYAIATVKINLYLRKKQTAEKLMAANSGTQTANAQSSEPDIITWPILHNAILKLKPKDQAVITLRFFENLAAARIAEIMGYKADSARIRIAKIVENTKIFDSEKHFEDIVKKLDIDNAPDPAHKERLRAKILAAFNAGGKKNQRTLLCFLVAAIVLITTAPLFVLYRSDQKKYVPQVIVKPSQPVVETNLPDNIAEKTRLEKIQQLAAEKKTSELLKILRSDDLTAKLLAAKYLAEITDSNVADIIKLVSEKQADSAKPVAQKSKEQKTILIKTINKKTNLPLADVSLQIHIDSDKDAVDALTDNKGQYLFALTVEPSNRLQISTAKKGYAQMKLNRYGSGQTKLLLPDIVSFEMSPAIEVGGIVKNERLQSIEGAEIKLIADSNYGSENPYFNISSTFKTDTNGLWKCDLFPEDACRASIMVTHPDYILQDEYRPAIVEELENFSFVTILEKGITVSGRVLDVQHKPLQATIIKGVDRHGSSVICDSNGWFHFDNIAPSVEIFTVQYKGASPQIEQADIHPNMPPIVFNLEPANTIRGRAIDVNGNPIKDVYIQLESWHGFASLNFETQTDANGFFKWADAPADEVFFSLSKSGYMSVRNFSMKSENDYVIMLQPPFKITGAVTSRDSNHPVSTFKIIPGFYHGDSDKILWQEHNAFAFSGNRYKLIITEPFDFRLRIQADGFMSAESPDFSPQQDTVNYDFILELINADLHDKSESTTGKPDLQKKPPKISRRL
jgi:RNA polymerase sigma-70 factor (ECF subfamily)